MFFDAGKVTFYDEIEKTRENGRDLGSTGF